MFGHSHDGCLDDALEFFFFEIFAGSGRQRTHQVDELAAFLVAGTDGGLEGVGGTPGLRTHEIAGLVGGDCEEPRAEAAFGIKLAGGLVDLEECFLEDIFGSGSVAKEADEEMEQFALVAFDQLGEAGFVSEAVCLDELFVGQAAGGVCARGRWGFWLLSAIGPFSGAGGNSGLRRAG